MHKSRLFNLNTIDRFIANEEIRYPHASGEFTNLMHDLSFAMRIIAREVRRAGINDIIGMTDNYNVHGERVRKIDEFANDCIYEIMNGCGTLCALISEENTDVMTIPNDNQKGKYILAFDPLDGSTNIDVNVTIGTIFALYRRKDPSSKEVPTNDDLLQPGVNLVASGYVLYGSSTTMVYTTGDGVDIFTYDPTLGEFLLTNENIRMPKRGFQYSCNEGNYFKWNENIRKYIDFLKTPSEDGLRPYSLRYIATAVADINRLLYYGGVYLYPTEKKYPNGKIRLLYEANPLAMIVEQAGGRAITGKGRIMEEIPVNIHQQVPFFVGSEYEITLLEEYLKG